MSSYAEVADALESVVTGLGLTLAQVPFDAVSLPNVDGLYFIDFTAGEDAFGSPGGDDQGSTVHTVAVSFLKLINPQDWTTSRNAALSTVEGIRNGLDANPVPAAMSNVNASARYVDYSLDRIGNSYLATVGFEVEHHHTYT